MLNKYSQNEFNKRKELILEDLNNKFESQINPQAILIVGQPGAGKTTLADLFYKNIFINGDTYRNYHPYFDELCEKYGDDYVEHTRKFAGEMTEILINELSDKKYNLTIEGTLRTAEVPIKTKNILESKGYQVKLTCLLVRPEISFLSTVKRYKMMKEINLSPRQTPKEHHDLVIKSIISNLDYLYKTKNFTDIQIYNRQSECLYDSNITPNKNPANLFQKEFFRKLTKEEAQSIINDYKNYISEKNIIKVLKEYDKERENMLFQTINNLDKLKGYHP